MSKLLVGRLLLSDLARRNKLLRAVERLRLRVAKLVGRESEGAVRADEGNAKESTEGEGGEGSRCVGVQAVVLT